MAPAKEPDLRTLGGRVEHALALEKRSQRSVEADLIKRKVMASHGGLSSLIKGRRGTHSVKLDVVVALARILHVRLEWLASGNGPVRRDGRVEATPFEQAMALARQAECPEEVIQAAWKRYQDRAASLTVFDWINLIHTELVLFRRAETSKEKIA